MLEIDEPGEKPIKGELLAPHFVLGLCCQKLGRLSILEPCIKQTSKIENHGPAPPPPVPARRDVLRLSGQEMVSRKRTAVL
jgi:hypothetical protein